MLILTEIAEKLNKVLNGTDTEIGGLVNPTDYVFQVATQGFHLDTIADKKKGKNFIPVFISSMGGEYDPVPTLKRVSYSIPVTFYFPVRFKEQFFSLNEFLASYFVGTIKTYGTNKKALSNISVAQYGEIQNLDLNQFRGWVEGLYQQEINITEPWMTMTLNLYLSTIDSSFLFGNSVTFSLSYKITVGGAVVTRTEELAWSNGGTGLSVSPIAQQLIDTDNYSKNVSNIVSRSQSILAYVKNSTFWSDLLTAYNSGTLDTLTDLTLTKTYGFATPVVTTFTSIILGVNENIARGEPLSFTITFGDKI